jgi:rubrerythrin
MGDCTHAYLHRYGRDAITKQQKYRCRDCGYIFRGPKPLKKEKLRL